MNKKQANEIIGGLSRPSKMPCYSYNLPAQECKVGAALMSVENTPCFYCYANTRRYLFPNVQTAMYRRLNAIQDSRWPDAMVAAIGKADYFRWHDSGDIQSFLHLQKIVDIARRLPKTKFWLPSREIKLIRQYVRANTVPDNLTIRISATMVDQPAKSIAIDWNTFLPTSTVHNKKPAIGFECPAPKQDGKCADCRACWDKSIQNISYRKH